MRKSFLILTLAAATCMAQAQTPATPATPATPSAPSSPAKKELVAKVLKLQQSGIEAMAHELVKQPANELMSSAIEFVQTQVPADKRDAIGKGLQQDADKYMNETYPVVRDRAVKLAPSTVGALLEEKFTEDELKQVLQIMESPVYNKFQALGPDMQRVLMAKLVPDVRPEVGTHLRTLDESIAKRLGVQAALQQGAPAPGSGSAPAPGTAPAPAGKAPAKK